MIRKVHFYIYFFLLSLLIQGCEKQSDGTINNLEGEVIIALTNLPSRVQNEEISIALYPHPFNEMLVISIGGEFETGILNLPGKDGNLSQIEIIETNSTLYLSFADYSEGFYYMEIKLDESIFRFRILKLGN